MHPAIAVRELRKTYGALVAVDGVSLSIEPGEVYALLGHNGAGKTTAVEILEGHRARTSGEVSVLGVDPAHGGRELRDRIGIVLQTSGIEGELTVAEAVDIYGSCYTRRRPTEEVLALAGLSEQTGQRIATLSGGQKRRIDLALGIVGRPELLFLDEPTTGFDPSARRGAWDVLRQLGSGGTTMLLTTHYLDEAEHLADRVGVISRGRLIAEGTPAELIGRAASTIVRFQLPAGVELADLGGVVPGGVTTDGRRVEFPTDSATADVHALCGWALERNLELTGLQVDRPSLEDVFLAMTDDEPDEPSQESAERAAP